MRVRRSLSSASRFSARDWRSPSSRSESSLSSRGNSVGSIGSRRRRPPLAVCARNMSVKPDTPSSSFVDCWISTSLIDGPLRPVDVVVVVPPERFVRWSWVTTTGPSSTSTLMTCVSWIVVTLLDVELKFCAMRARFFWKKASRKAVSVALRSSGRSNSTWPSRSFWSRISSTSRSLRLRSSMSSFTLRNMSLRASVSTRILSHSSSTSSRWLPSCDTMWIVWSSSLS
mmetsp:Transcript_48291/g.148984  ORF Transcript_48291/g.148984 Transcript_48291/m.148984 type:complete len:228 (-) Transcript_48291:218-901(-)